MISNFLLPTFILKKKKLYCKLYFKLTFITQQYQLCSIGYFSVTWQSLKAMCHASLSGETTLLEDYSLGRWAQLDIYRMTCVFGEAPRLPAGEQAPSQSFWIIFAEHVLFRKMSNNSDGGLPSCELSNPISEMGDPIVWTIIWGENTQNTEATPVKS